MSDTRDRDQYLCVYAKRHYQRTEVIADLTQIVSRRAGSEPHYVTVSDILQLLLETIEPLMSTRPHALRECVRCIRSETFARRDHHSSMRERTRHRPCQGRRHYHD